jgi:hypothetical protein
MPREVGEVAMPLREHLGIDVAAADKRVVGRDGVWDSTGALARYFTVMSECATASKLRAGAK